MRVGSVRLSYYLNKEILLKQMKPNLIKKDLRLKMSVTLVAIPISQITEQNKSNLWDVLVFLKFYKNLVSARFCGVCAR